jgi:type IV fimbrial biogenesis protein FimT
MKKERGFTLLELMVTVTIVAILAALAAPSFTRLIADNNLSTQVNSLLADLRFARSEAIKRGINITLCPSSTSLNTTATCSGSDWRTGWIAFIDADANNSRANTETILRRQEAFAAGASIVSNNPTPISSLRFNAEGRIPGGMGALNFTAVNNIAPNRLLCISVTGRVRVVEKGATSC